MTSEAHQTRLLIVTTTFPRWKDDPGPAPFVYHLARALLRHFAVTVLAPHYPGAAGEEVMDGVTVRRFRYAWPERLELLADGAGIQNHLRRSRGRALLAAPLLAGEFRAIRRELRRGYDCVNSHWLVPSGLLVALALPRSGPRHLITAHAADYDLLQKLPGGRRIIRYLVHSAAAVAAVSPRLAEGIEQAAGGGARVIVQPMGVDRELFRDADQWRREAREKIGVRDDEPLVMFAGKLTAKKGVEVLLRSAALAAARARAFRLLIAGDGELRPGLERLAEQLGLRQRTVFLGAVPNRELARLYGAADVVAVPSVRDARGETEGMPVVILEALAAGRPVAATRVCSTPRELVGRGVIEVNEGDPEALEAAISAALAGRAGLDPDAVSGYDMNRVADRYAEILLRGLD